MVVFNMNSGIFPCFFTSLHRTSKEFFRSDPIFDNWNISLDIPEGSLAFPEHSPRRTFSSSCISKGLVLFFLATLSFIFMSLLLKNNVSFISGLQGLALSRSLYSFKRSVLKSDGDDIIFPLWFRFATGIAHFFFGQSFLLSFHISVTLRVFPWSQYFLNSYALLLLSSANISAILVVMILHSSEFVMKSSGNYL